MPYTTAVAGQVITAAWANANVRDQVITPFVSTSARDSAISTPVVGMVEYLKTGDAAEGLTTRTSANTWRLPWNLPWGRAGLPYLAKTAAQATATSADLSGMSTTFTPIAGRRYRIWGHVPRAQVQTSPGEVGVNIALAGTVVTGARCAGDAGDIFQLSMEITHDASSSTPVNLKMSMGIVTAGGIEVTGDSLNPIFLGVEDIGPSGVPS